MAKRAITREIYAAMLAAFTEQPGNIRYCAGKVGLDRRTVKRGWELGFPWAPEGSGVDRPLRDVLAEQQEIARARIVQLELESKQRTLDDERKRVDEQRKAADIDSTKSRVEEAQMIRMGRASATALLSVLTRLAGAVARNGDKVKTAIEAYALKPELTPQEANHVVRLIGTITANVNSALNAANQAMQMERLLLGEPNQIVAIQQYGQDVTVEEAEARIRAAQDVLNSFRGQVVDAKFTGPAALPQVNGLAGVTLNVPTARPATGTPTPTPTPSDGTASRTYPSTP